MEIEERIAALGLELPVPPAPGGSYTSVNVRGSIAYVAIQFPIIGDDFLFLGKFGENLTTKDGFQAAELTALNILSQVNHYLDIEKVAGLNHLDIYYRGSSEWDEAPKVANGASELMTKVLEGKGTHTRGIYGVEHLPRNFSVGITSSFTIGS